jgi:hypothetical protein
MKVINTYIVSYNKEIVRLHECEDNIWYLESFIDLEGLVNPGLFHISIDEAKRFLNNNK